MATRSIASTLRHAELQDRYYRPRRARFDEAAAAAREADTAAEAWESMAARGLIPFDWVPHATRRFVAHAPGAACAPQAYPPTRAACVAFASDARNLLAAEELARELAARLAPWGVRAPPSVVWVTAGWLLPLSLRASGFAPLLDALHGLGEAWATPRVGRYALRDRSKARVAAREASARERRERWAAVRDGPHAHPAAVISADLARALALWEFARDEHLHVSRLATFPRRLPQALAGVRVASLPSPFEPLVALYELGYGLGPVTPEALHLVAVEPDLA